MIKDKTTGAIISGNVANKDNVALPSGSEVTEEISEMPDNGIIDVFNAIKTILKGVRWKYNDKNSERIFKTVKHNSGQYEHIVSSGPNEESEMAFPAAYISFINIRWTSNQNTICEGTAELRIQFIMNTLNNHDDDKETEIYYVAQRIIQTIQEEKYDYPQLLKECKLTFMDTATTYHSGLQSCWLTYSIKFTEISVWVKRNTVRRFVICPPFTNHSDQDDPATQNVLNHTNADHTESYDEQTHFSTKFES